MQQCIALVTAAQQSFQILLLAFVADNIAMGITNSGKVGLIGNALKDVQFYGAAGSLWECYNALNSVVITPEMAPYLTQARVDWLKNQMLAAIANL